MNLIRKSATALLGLSLVTATAGAQSWTSVAAGSLNQAGGAGYWDQLSYDGSGCNIGYIIFGIRSATCKNGGAGEGRWSGGTGALVSARASFVDPGSAFLLGKGTWRLDVLGGFRGFGQGWLPTDPEYIGVTDCTRITKFTGPASYTVTYASDFSLAMPGYLPREQVYSGGSFKTGPASRSSARTTARRRHSPA